MRSYQTLCVIAGILGLLIVFAAYMVFGAAVSIQEQFFGETEDKSTVEWHVGISVLFYIIVLVLPFALKKAKPVGYTLFVISFITLLSASWFGIISSAILVAAGIAAVRWKGKESNRSLDYLKERYAKGEITKQEFDEMKKDLQ